MDALTVVAQGGMIDTAVLGQTLRTWLILALAAFAGGAFGAAVGALPALGLTGVLVVAGEVAELAGWAPQSTPLPPGPVAVSSSITGSVALGPLFGPHVSFAGGAAAAAYATRKGYLDTDFEYYAAKCIARPLGLRPRVLVVGGLFGVLGLLLTRLSTGIVPGGLSTGLPWDPIAFGVVLGALFHRVVLGFPLVGAVRADGGSLDMSSFDPGRMRHAAMGSETRVEGSLAAALSAAVASVRGGVDEGDDEGVGRGVGRGDDEGVGRGVGSGSTDSDADPQGESDHVAETTLGTGSESSSESSQGIVPSATSGRLVVEPWQPRYFAWRDVAGVGVVVGLVASGIALLSGSAFLAFGVSAASLFGLAYGIEDVPVTHHVALPASTAALATTAGVATLSVPGLVVGTLFGLGAALVGELAQRVGYAHGDTHLDPASVAILVLTAVIALLAVGGVFSTAVWIPVPVTI